MLGGELSYQANLTSLSRGNADFDPITATRVDQRPVRARPAPTRRAKIPANCLLRGIPGDYIALSAEAQWQRSITDPFGQMFTPFVVVARRRRHDVDQQRSRRVELSSRPATAPSSARMPTVGLEYRYPFISVQSWGTQTIEPIAQVIVRPNEPSIGKLPNEDSQSLIFDDSNLFKVDKFSGWDRVEGGGRANVGVQYTAQFNRGGFVNALFGQSYQLFGTNSFAVGDPTNTGLNSGLDTNALRLCRRASPISRTSIYTFTTRFRFDHDDLRRCSGSKLEAAANFDRWSCRVLYGNYAAQPQLGFLTAARAFSATRTVKLDANWVADGAIRYDLDADKFDQHRVRRRLYRRLPHRRPELHHELHLQRQRRAQISAFMLQIEPAHAGRQVGRPDVSAARPSS